MEFFKVSVKGQAGLLESGHVVLITEQDGVVDLFEHGSPALSAKDRAVLIKIFEAPRKLNNFNELQEVHPSFEELDAEDDDGASVLGEEEEEELLQNYDAELTFQIEEEAAETYNEEEEIDLLVDSLQEMDLVEDGTNGAGTAASAAAAEEPLEILPVRRLPLRSTSTGTTQKDSKRLRAGKEPDISEPDAPEQGLIQTEFLALINLYYYVPLGFLVCLICKGAVPLCQVENHVQGKHKHAVLYNEHSQRYEDAPLEGHCITFHYGEKGEKLKQRIKDSLKEAGQKTILDGSNDLKNDEEWKKVAVPPQVPCAPIPCLYLYEHGFTCRICGHSGASWESIRKHPNTKHPKYKEMGYLTAASVILKDVPVQTFNRGWQHFFSVDPSLANIGPAVPFGLEDNKAKAKQAIYAETDALCQNIEKKMQGNVDLLHPFIRTSGIHKFLSNFERRSLLTYISFPNPKKHPILKALRNAAKARFMSSCEAVNQTHHSVQVQLNTCYENARFPAKPFMASPNIKTRDVYFRLELQMIWGALLQHDPSLSSSEGTVRAVRGQKKTQNLSQSLYRFDSAQINALEALAQILRKSRCQQKDIIVAIIKLLHAFYFPSNMDYVIDDRFGGPVQAFFAALWIAPADPEAYRPLAHIPVFLSKLQHNMRLQAFEHLNAQRLTITQTIAVPGPSRKPCIYPSKPDVHHTRTSTRLILQKKVTRSTRAQMQSEGADSDGDNSEYEEEEDSIGEDLNGEDGEKLGTSEETNGWLNSDVKPFCRKYLREGEMTPFADVRHYMHVLTRAVKGQKARDMVDWSPNFETLLFMDKSISFADYQENVARSIADFQAFVKEQILFSIDLGMLGIDLDALKDNGDEKTLKYTPFWTTTPGGLSLWNPDAKALFDALIDREQLFHLSPKVEVRKTEAAAWLAKLERATAWLSALIHATQGPPGRGTEEACFLISNSQTSRRHLFIDNNAKTTATSSNYHKGLLNTGLYKQIYREHPPALGRMLILLLRVVRPIEHFIVKRIHGTTPEFVEAATEAYLTGLFVTYGRRWNATKLSSALQWWTGQVIGTRMGIRQYRHFATALQRVPLKAELRKELKDENSAALQSLMKAVDLMAGHTKETSELNYAGEKNSAGLPSSMRHTFIKISRAWRHMLGIE